MKNNLTTIFQRVNIITLSIFNLIINLFIILFLLYGIITSPDSINIENLSNNDIRKIIDVIRNVEIEELNTKYSYLDNLNSQSSSVNDSIIGESSVYKEGQANESNDSITPDLSKNVINYNNISKDESLSSVRLVDSIVSTIEESTLIGKVKLVVFKLSSKNN